MKNTFLLDQYIALMECKLTLAKLHKEKHLAIRNNQFELAADLRAQQYDTKAQIENITEDAWNYFTHDHARSRAYRWGEDGLGGSGGRLLLLVVVSLPFLVGRGVRGAGPRPRRRPGECRFRRRR